MVTGVSNYSNGIVSGKDIFFGEYYEIGQNREKGSSPTPTEQFQSP